MSLTFLIVLSLVRNCFTLGCDWDAPGPFCTFTVNINGASDIEETMHESSIYNDSQCCTYCSYYKNLHNLYGRVADNTTCWYPSYSFYYDAIDMINNNENIIQFNAGNFGNATCSNQVACGSWNLCYQYDSSSIRLYGGSYSHIGKLCTTNVTTQACVAHNNLFRFKIIVHCKKKPTLNPSNSPVTANPTQEPTTIPTNVPLPVPNITCGQLTVSVYTVYGIGESCMGNSLYQPICIGTELYWNYYGNGSDCSQQSDIYQTVSNEMFQFKDYITNYKCCNDLGLPKDPTAAPLNFGETKPPTPWPINLPTNAPSEQSTPSPTAYPTPSPTKDPVPSVTNGLPTSIAPTNAHSSITAHPTASPTQNPTSFPSVEPTILFPSTETNMPSTSPTMEPTLEPTDNPTMEPNVTATEDLTYGPIVVTNDPTYDPTHGPTTGPTDNHENSGTTTDIANGVMAILSTISAGCQCFILGVWILMLAH